MPPVKKPIKAKSYSSIGAVEGVMLDSELINAKPGQNYKLSADYRGDGKPFIWIKGFLTHPKRKTLVDGYQTRLQPDNPDKHEWRTFSIGFNPTAKSPRIEKFKVRLYAFWPNGTYYFDNIRVEEITPEEMQKLVKKRGDAEKKPPEKSAEKPITQLLNRIEIIKDDQRSLKSYDYGC